jgi:hypothetical protein
MMDLGIRRTVESDLLRIRKRKTIAASSYKVYKYGIPFVDSCRGLSILDCGFVDCCPEDTKSWSRQAETVQISTIQDTELIDITPREHISSTAQTLQNQQSVLPLG